MKAYTRHCNLREGQYNIKLAIHFLLFCNASPAGSSGNVTFNNVQWRPNNNYYIFRADALTQNGEHFTLKRKFLPGAV